MRNLTNNTFGYTDRWGSNFEAKIELEIDNDGSFRISEYKYYDADEQSWKNTGETDGWNDAPATQIEELFNVKIENNKIIEEPIEQQGFGSGSGEIIRVLARNVIEAKIEEISCYDAFMKAAENQNRGYIDGYACVSLLTGNFSGYAMGQNESNHACDNNYIDLYRIGQNDEIDEEVLEFIEIDELNCDVSDELDCFYSDLTI